MLHGQTDINKAFVCDACFLVRSFEGAGVNTIISVCIKINRCVTGPRVGGAPVLRPSPPTRRVNHHMWIYFNRYIHHLITNNIAPSRDVVKSK